MGVVLHRSVFGRYLYAVGKNEEAARYSGISTGLVIAAAYILAAGSPASRPVLLRVLHQLGLAQLVGNFYELYAIAAAVLGGCSLRGGEGSILGIVLGTALLQVLQNLVNILGIPSSLNFAVMGTVILLGVLADQQLQDGAGSPPPPRCGPRGGGLDARPGRTRRVTAAPTDARAARPEADRQRRQTRRGGGAQPARAHRQHARRAHRRRPGIRRASRCRPRSSCA